MKSLVLNSFICRHKYLPSPQYPAFHSPMELPDLRGTTYFQAFLASCMSPLSSLLSKSGW